MMGRGKVQLKKSSETPEVKITSETLKHLKEQREVLKKKEESPFVLEVINQLDTAISAGQRELEDAIPLSKRLANARQREERAEVKIQKKALALASYASLMTAAMEEWRNQRATLEEQLEVQKRVLQRCCYQ